MFIGLELSGNLLIASNSTSWPNKNVSFLLQSTKKTVI